jgi:hypothetical protein
MSEYSEHPLMTVRLENAAYHELGHCAIAALEFGVTVKQVEVFPGRQDDNSTPDGITIFGDDIRKLPRDSVIKIYLAGSFAERRIRSNGWRDCIDDYKRVAKLMRGTDLDIRRLSADTELLLTKHWQAIELGAWELGHKRLLVGNDAILEAVRPWKP